jgi:hypothetical protein
VISNAIFAYTLKIISRLASMNIFEVVCTAFFALVEINLSTMIWALKKAPPQETFKLNDE